MNRGIFTIASGALAALARMDAVAQNLANVNTAGYKAEHPEFRLREFGTDGVHTAANAIVGKAAGEVVEVERVRDFSQGPLQQTGNPLDVAITGDGFFVVNTANGERYTRSGNFSTDAEGYLVTGTGQRVQGTGGDLQVKGNKIVIGADGNVQVDGRQAGALKLVGFGKTPALLPEGAGLFKATPAAKQEPIDTANASITQGAVEGANIDAIGGMVELVDVSRGYEQYMKALERMDQLTQKSINELGRVG